MASPESAMIPETYIVIWNIKIFLIKIYEYCFDITVITLRLFLCICIMYSLCFHCHFSSFINFCELMISWFLPIQTERIISILHLANILHIYDNPIFHCYGIIWICSAMIRKIDIVIWNIKIFLIKIYEYCFDITVLIKSMSKSRFSSKFCLSR